MITIDQDALCDHCERSFEEDRGRCEGRNCEPARVSYLEDNGLTKDEPQVFGDLRRGDTIYMIYDGSLTKEKVESIREDSDGLRIQPKGYSRSSLKVDSSVNDTKTWFVSKTAAVKEYTDRMSRKMKKMMQNIIDIEKAE